jgi:hypothetical protein
LKVPSFRQTLGSGKILQIFRVKMQSGTNSWFVSEPDKDQPVTTLDTDFYRRTSEENFPPLTGGALIAIWKVFVAAEMAEENSAKEDRGAI